MSDGLTKAICRICGEDVYFFPNSEDSSGSFELTCPNGHSDCYSSAAEVEVERKPGAKTRKAEVAAAAG